MRFDAPRSLDALSPALRSALAEKTVLVIGAGGIGAPLGFALAHTGLSRLVVCDDDRVELSNLHRQILFEESDIGRPKLDAFKSALLRIAPSIEVELAQTRFLPDVANELLERADVVVDATDNFASRFLIADASILQNRAVVHAAAVRWTATVMASSPNGGPCYRCLFEDLPTGDAPDCATAGVMGPVCGVAGALAAELVVRILAPETSRESPYGFIFTYDGKSDRLRKVGVESRADCPLCGPSALIRDLDEARYAGPSCSSDSL